MGNSQEFPQILSSYPQILKVNIHQEFANAVEMKSYIDLTSDYFAQAGLSIVNNQLSVWP